ncbi:MAG TPA: TonB-dependent receptor, partial [Terriglobales bacterium]|nr:TonB-dependent receptor [Terriglobales bacterium]
EELQLQGRAFDNRLNYQLGAYFEHAGPFGDFQGTRSGISISCTDLLANQCSNPYGAGFVQNSLTRYKFTNIGFYGQGTYKLTEQLSITGGIRYTIDKVEAEGATRLIRFLAPNMPSFTCSRNTTLVADDPRVCSIFDTQKSERPTWLVDIDYYVTPDAMLYAKYSRGYRQGSTNVSNTIPVSWGPESVDAYEIGAKLSFDGAVRGYFNIAAFYNNLRDQQVPASLVPAPGTTNSPAQAIVNAGKSRIKGIEVDASITPFDGFNVTLGYAYLDTELVAANALPTPPPGYTINASAAVGEDLAYSPKHRVVLGGRYTLPLPESVGRISLGATYAYTASQQSVYYMPTPTSSPFSNPFGKLPSTNILDLNLNWNKIAGSNVDLSLFVTNVTKEKYDVAIGNGFFTAGYEYAIRGQPRMFGARLRYSFGD